MVNKYRHFSRIKDPVYLDSDFLNLSLISKAAVDGLKSSRTVGILLMGAPGGLVSTSHLDVLILPDFSTVTRYLVLAVLS